MVWTGNLSWDGILSAIAATVPVFVVYWLTTREDRAKAQAAKTLAAEAAPAFLAELEKLIEESMVLRQPIYPIARERASKLKALCDFGELRAPDIYHAEGTKAYFRFGHLRRIAYHYRDEGDRALRRVEAVVSGTQVPIDSMYVEYGKSQMRYNRD